MFDVVEHSGKTYSSLDQLIAEGANLLVNVEVVVSRSRHL